MRMRLLAVLAAVVALPGCAALNALGAIVQPPRFHAAEGRRAELQLIGPSHANPRGGARIRLWAEVSNPNPFGFRLERLAGMLVLEGQDAATIDLPLGLPLRANGTDTVPIDLVVGFDDLGVVRRMASQALGGDTVSYDVEGTVSVDAGQLGTPTFGPSRWLSGALQIR